MPAPGRYWRERHLRHAVLHSKLLAVSGRWQREDGACNVIAGHLEDLTPMFVGLAETTTPLAPKSRDFR